jgi:hypothetical protein
MKEIIYQPCFRKVQNLMNIMRSHSRPQYGFAPVLGQDGKMMEREDESSFAMKSLISSLLLTSKILHFS